MGALTATLIPKYYDCATYVKEFPADVMSLGTPICLSHFVGSTYFRHVIMSSTKRGLCIHSILPPTGLFAPLDVDALRKKEKKERKKQKQKAKAKSEFMTTDLDRVQGMPMCDQLKVTYQDESLGDEERLEAFCEMFSTTEDVIQRTKNAYYSSGLSFSEFLHSLGTNDDLYECLCGSGFATRSCPCKAE